MSMKLLGESDGREKVIGVLAAKAEAREVVAAKAKRKVRMKRYRVPVYCVSVPALPVLPWYWAAAGWGLGALFEALLMVAVVVLLTWPVWYSLWLCWGEEEWYQLIQEERAMEAVGKIEAIQAEFCENPQGDSQ